jgi:serine/threonine protein phosphatase 1
MPERIIAIGDIHGCADALHAVLQAAEPDVGDTVVTLGDYVDRGPDSRGALEQLIELSYRCRLVPILGNHDELLLRILDGHQYLLADWLMVGGDTTLASYGASVPDEIPPEHVDFLRHCLAWYETERYFFVHAGYRPHLPLKKQPPEVLRWEPLSDPPPGPHRSRKIAVVGHTAQRDGEVLDLGHLKCIDTHVYGNGWLTALDLSTGQIWQADKQGGLRLRM